jgi:4-hydroxybenzoate polyprenyltransferase
MTSPIQNRKWYLQISRPRFWFYLFGPFLLGLAAGIDQVGVASSDVLLLIVFGLFFLYPANLLIYGVNDLFDYETDKNNPKKKAYESLIEPKNRQKFTANLLITVAPFTAVGGGLLASNGSYIALYSLAAFMFFGICYSAPPIRAKTKPFLDAFFNVLYIFPGFVSYAIITDSLPSWTVVIAATAWVMAMHAFSAVPDIDSDKKAGISTVATVLGHQRTILFCFLLYLLTSFSIDRVGGQIGLVFSYIAIIYMVLMTIARHAKTDESLFKVYRAFPVVNVLVGAALFFGILLLSK